MGASAAQLTRRPSEHAANATAQCARRLFQADEERLALKAEIAEEREVPEPNWWSILELLNEFDEANPVAQLTPPSVPTSPPAQSENLDKQPSSSKASSAGSATVDLQNPIDEALLSPEDSVEIREVVALPSTADPADPHKQHPQPAAGADVQESPKVSILQRVMPSKDDSGLSQRSERSSHTPQGKQKKRPFPKVLRSCGTSAMSAWNPKKTAKAARKQKKATRKQKKVASANADDAVTEATKYKSPCKRIVIARVEHAVTSAGHHKAPRRIRKGKFRRRGSEGASRPAEEAQAPPAGEVKETCLAANSAAKLGDEPFSATTAQSIDVARVRTVAHSRPTHCGLNALQLIIDAAAAVDDDEVDSANNPGARRTDAAELVGRAFAAEGLRKQILERGEITISQFADALKHAGISAKAIPVHEWPEEHGVAEVTHAALRHPATIGAAGEQAAACVVYGKGHIEVAFPNGLASRDSNGMATMDIAQKPFTDEPMRGKKGRGLKMDKQQLIHFLSCLLARDEETELPPHAESTKQGLLPLLNTVGVCSISSPTTKNRRMKDDHYDPYKDDTGYQVTAWWNSSPDAEAEVKRWKEAKDRFWQKKQKPLSFSGRDESKESFLPPAQPDTAETTKKSPNSADKEVQQGEPEKRLSVASKAENKAVSVHPESAVDVAMVGAEDHHAESAAAASSVVGAGVFAEDDCNVDKAAAAVTPSPSSAASSPDPCAKRVREDFRFEDGRREGDHHAASSVKKTKVSAKPSVRAATTSAAPRDGVYKAESPRRIRQRGVEGCEAIAVCKGLHLRRSKATRLACAVEEELAFPKGDIRCFSPPSSGADLRLGFRLAVEAKAFETEYNLGTMQMPPASPLLFKIAVYEKQAKRKRSPTYDNAEEVGEPALKKPRNSSESSSSSSPSRLTKKGLTPADGRRYSPVDAAMFPPALRADDKDCGADDDCSLKRRSP
eukprot:g18068.t1